MEIQLSLLMTMSEFRSTTGRWNEMVCATEAESEWWELVGGDVGGAAAVAGGGLGSLDVQVEQLHLWGEQQLR